MKKIQLKQTAILLFLFSSLVHSNPANANFTYDFDNMVSFILNHSPVKRSWNGENFVETIVFKGVVEQPKVQLLTPEEMSEAAGSNAKGIVAFYDSDLNTMFLDKDIDPQSTEGYSVILHELVHHVQNATGVTGKSLACPESLEFDAYRIQLIYLNSKIESGTKMDQEFLKMIEFGSLMMSSYASCNIDRPFK